MWKAPMNDELVKTLNPQLAKLVLKKIANLKQTAMEPQLPFAQIMEKIHQKDVTKTHNDSRKIKTNSTLSPSLNNISIEKDGL